MRPVQALQGGLCAASSAEWTNLDAYAEAALDIFYTRTMHHYRWTVAGTTWALTGDVHFLERYVLPGLGSDIQQVLGPPAPDLTHIHWVDAAKTKCRFNPPPCSITNDSGAIGTRGIWLNDRVRVEYQVHEDILTVADLSSGRALVQVASLSGELPYYEQAAPIRGLLHGLMPRVGLHLLHAAVIGRSEAGVLIVGPGGSGKSSVALAGLMAGMHYIGDDYVLVDQGDVDESRFPRAYGLYATAKIARADVHLGMPASATLLNPNGAPSDKAALRLHPEPSGFRSGLPLKALLVPRIGGSAMQIEPCSRAQALASLAPSTLLQMAGNREALFAQCARLARQLPAFTFHTGPRTARYPKDVAGTLNRLLDEIAVNHDSLNA